MTANSHPASQARTAIAGLAAVFALLAAMTFGILTFSTQANAADNTHDIHPVPSAHINTDYGIQVGSGDLPPTPTLHINRDGGIQVGSGDLPPAISPIPAEQLTSKGIQVGSGDQAPVRDTSYGIQVGSGDLPPSPRDDN